MADSRGRLGEALEMKTPLWRKLEIAAAWVAVALAWCAGLLGLVCPLLGGPGPGLQGPVGFASETVAALWVPIVLLTAVLFVAILIRRLWWHAAALVPVVLVTLVPELWARSVSPAVHPSSNGPTLRIAAVNLAEQNLVDPSMEVSLRQLDADVLVLSEFTTAWTNRLEEWFADDYSHRWLGTAPDRSGHYTEGHRVAIWSRIPPAGDHEVLRLRGIAPQLRVPLRWRGRSFAVYGIHPGKPYPYGLYVRTWRDRRQLLDWIRSERLPTIVAGDFNAPPGSALIRQLRRFGLTNASEEVCGYAPVTWPMVADQLVPIRVAIDHVMHSKSFTAVGFQRGMTTNSDHAPVFAELVWRKE